MTNRAMTFQNRVDVTIADHVAHVQLNRPDKLNALDEAMFNGIVEAGQSLFEARDVRCVVLSGVGRAFCAGLDLGSMAQIGRHDSSPLPTRTHGNCNRSQYAAMVWRKLPMPVIGAVHGVCFGGGLQIASGPEIRIVSPDVRMAIMESKWGLVPDMAGYALWRGTVRDDVLRELTYTHREFAGQDAVRFGFATHVAADPVAHALQLAREIAGKNPHAIRAAKAISNKWHDSTADELLMAESHYQHELMGTRNQLEAVQAGLEKRAPLFVDP